MTYKVSIKSLNWTVDITNSDWSDGYMSISNLPCLAKQTQPKMFKPQWHYFFLAAYFTVLPLLFPFRPKEESAKSPGVRLKKAVAFSSG